MRSPFLNCFIKSIFYQIIVFFASMSVNLTCLILPTFLSDSGKLVTWWCSCFVQSLQPELRPGADCREGQGVGREGVGCREGQGSPHKLSSCWQQTNKQTISEENKLSWQPTGLSLGRSWLMQRRKSLFWWVTSYSSPSITQFATLSYKTSI